MASPAPAHLRLVSAPRPRGRVVWVHGFAEHGGRYGHVQDALAQAGYGSLAFDLPGHGHAPGERGHIERFDDYLAALDPMIERAADLGPGPLALMGHSFGGLIATAWVQARDPRGERLAALGLTAPAFAFGLPLPAHRRLLAHLASGLVPTLRRPHGIDAALLSHDPRNALAIQRDELRLSTASARWYTEALAAQKRVRAAAERLALPLGLFLAGDDAIVDNRAAREVVAAAPSASKVVREYPGLFHELLNEVERARVLGDLCAWLDEVLQM